MVEHVDVREIDKRAEGLERRTIAFSVNLRVGNMSAHRERRVDRVPVDSNACAIRIVGDTVVQWTPRALYFPSQKG